MANSVENPISPLLIGSFAPLAFACLLAGPISAHAADVVVQPAAGSGFVVKDAGGANERLRVQESGVINLPGIPAAPAQAQGLCMSAGGQLGPCSGGTGGSYTAATGLSLTGTTFSVAPTYRLPQTCRANEFAQWNGTDWTCGSAVGASLPSGAENQTLRYDAANNLVANPRLQAFEDGGLLAKGNGFLGIPVTGPGGRLMWYSGGNALRAGFVDSTQWDPGNVGAMSIAMSYNSIAKGFGSVALGAEARALQDYSVAIGEYASAEDKYSVALGNGKAKGYASIALGNGSPEAQGSWSVAIGDRTHAIGQNSLAIGRSTIADGADSTAIGSNVGTGGHEGSFIYGDASPFRTAIVNDAANQFMVIADGGVKFISKADGSSGAWLQHGMSAWTTLSDRNAKTAVRPIDAREVLKKVTALPLNTWQYKAQDAKYRHMGPMAQDFYAAFRLGESDTGIDTVDADGVALAAIQGLNAELAERDRKIATLSSQMDALAKSKNAEIAAIRGELSAQTKRVAALESLAGDVASLKKQLAASHQPATTTVALAHP